MFELNFWLISPFSPEIKCRQLKVLAITSALPKEGKTKIKEECFLQEFLKSLNTNDTYVMINNKYKLVKLVKLKEIYQSTSTLKSIVYRKSG